VSQRNTFQIKTRVSAGLRRELEKLAAAHERSLAAELRRAIAAYLAEQRKGGAA
jgi:hypothetical protein